MKKTIEMIVLPLATRYRVQGILGEGNTPGSIAAAYRRRRKTAGVAIALHAALTQKPQLTSYSIAWMGKANKDGYRCVCSPLDHFGLRLVGFSDKLLGLHHTGWFTEDDGGTDETYRGCVFGLPGKRGQSRYLPAYYDTSGECYIVDFSHVYTGPSVKAVYSDDATLRRVARIGDYMAQHDAKACCEFNRQYQDAARWLELQSELGGPENIASIKALRSELREQFAALDDMEIIEDRFPDVATYAKENF